MMLHAKYQIFEAFCFLARIFFNVFNKLLIEEKSGKLLDAQLKWNLSLLVKKDCDVSMESFITAQYIMKSLELLFKTGAVTLY